jgi:hypothetical protein
VLPIENFPVDVGRFTARPTFTIPDGFTSTRASGSEFHIGTTTVYYYDSTHMCSFIVTIVGECGHKIVLSREE